MPSPLPSIRGFLDAHFTSPDDLAAEPMLAELLRRARRLAPPRRGVARCRGSRPGPRSPPRPRPTALVEAQRGFRVRLAQLRGTPLARSVACASSSGIDPSAPTGYHSAPRDLRPARIVLFADVIDLKACSFFCDGGGSSLALLLQPVASFPFPFSSSHPSHPYVRTPPTVSQLRSRHARRPTPGAEAFADQRDPRQQIRPCPAPRTMGTSAQESPLWKRIDDAEYYLVSGSFEQAVLTALSVADEIRTAPLESACDQDELPAMLESAGMVLVQALKELRRAPEMFFQLKTMFGSVPSVPARVFLTGATIQMAAGSVSDLRPIFEEYLANWRYTDDEVYVLDGGHDSASNGFVVTSIMSTGQYFEVAELYTVTFLCIVSQDSETAISWAEKADLTEQRRQDLLKKLHAVQLAANKNLSTVEGVKQTAERNLSTSINDSTPLPHEDPPKIAPVYDGLKRVLVKSAQPSQRVTNHFDPLFWWFHSIRLKFGKIHIVVPSGKLMFLFSLLFSAMYVLRRKTAGLKRTVFQQAASLRRAFFDALQLAFSVQMNPLAAVQQVPQAPRGSW